MFVSKNKYNNLLSAYGLLYQSKVLVEKDADKLKKLLDVARYVISDRDFKIAKLQEELEELKSPRKRAVHMQNQALYLSEDQEDVEYMYKNELIDRATYEDMLAQLEFDNAEITFDYERI